MPVKNRNLAWELDEVRISDGRSIKFRLMLDSNNRPRQLDVRMFTATGIKTKIGISIPVKKISDISVVLNRVMRKLKGFERDFGKTT